MAEPSTPVTQLGANYFVSEQGQLTDQATTGGNARREYDFLELLKGAATFIRIVVANDCQLFFWNRNENKWKSFRIDPVGERGLIANRVMRVTNENWEKMAVVGPIRTGITVYASRIPGGGFSGVRTD